MTVLRFNNPPRWRETEVIYRGRKIRNICVALQPNAMLIRLKGTRAVVELPYSIAYIRACTLAADATRRAKKVNRSLPPVGK